MARVLCKKHPTYAAKRAPVSQCQVCLMAWIAAELQRLREDVKALTARYCDDDGWPI